MLGKKFGRWLPIFHKFCRWSPIFLGLVVLVSSVPKFCRWSPIFPKIYGGAEQVLKKFDAGSINLMLGTHFFPVPSISPHFLKKFDAGTINLMLVTHFSRTKYFPR